jgi:hypothetical protein
MSRIITKPPAHKATTKAQLLNRAKTLIEAGERSLRKGLQSLHDAAEALAIAKEEHGASQREMAKFVGKSLGWVNALLQWRLGGYKETSPFGPTTKKGRVQHAEQRAVSKPRKTLPAQAKNAIVTEDPNTKLIAADSKNDNTAEATTTGLIVADGKNDNTTEPSTTPADSKNDNTTEAPRTDASRPDRDASATALMGFKLAVDQWVPRMNYADRCDATSYLLKKAKVSVS